MTALFPSFFDSGNPAPCRAKEAKAANFDNNALAFSKISSFSAEVSRDLATPISNFSCFSRPESLSVGAAEGSLIDNGCAGAILWMDRAGALVESGLPREWADPFAKLLCGPPPGDFDTAYWARLLPGANMFADKWAAQAHALGWRASEVFGLDDVKPAARHDRKGVAWLLTDGALVVAIDAHRADIMTKQLARLRFDRRPSL